MKQILIILLFISSVARSQSSFFMLTKAASAAIDKTVTNIVSDGRYNSFGNVVPISSDEVLLSFRSGTDHYINGRIETIKYTASTKTWGNRNLLFTPPTGKDYRDPRLGVLNNEKLILFTSLYVTATSSFESMGYFLSTDMTGTSWGSYVTLPYPTGINLGITYGNTIATDTAGIYYTPAYGYTDATATTVSVWIWRTAYSGGGVSISAIPVYTLGSTQVSETTIEHVAVGKYVLISRNNASNVMQQFTSTNHGYTWSAPTATNMGTSASTAGSMGYLLKFNGSLWCSLMDRNNNYITVYKANTATDIPTATGWAANLHYNNANWLGYPSMCLIPGYTNRIIHTWAAELSSTNSVIRAQEEDFTQY